MTVLTWLVLGVMAFGRPDAVTSPVDDLDPRPSGRVTVDVVSDRPIAREGEAFSVHVEVTPRPGIHVYAPGNRDYAPVTLSLKWPRHLKVADPRYPASEPYIFGELREIVKVYQGPFRITQRVTIPRGSPAAGSKSLDVTGVLRYQSCNDRVCFPVESIPLRLTIPVRPSDSPPTPASQGSTPHLASRLARPERRAARQELRVTGLPERAASYSAVIAATFARLSDSGIRGGRPRSTASAKFSI